MRQLPAYLLAAAFCGTLLAGPAAAAPDKKHGVAVMSGAVQSDGTVINSSGIVSARRLLNTGRYEVDFIRSISACTRMVGIGQALRDNSVGTFAVARTRVSDVLPDQLQVDIQNLNGQFVDHDFQIIIICAR